MSDSVLQLCVGQIENLEVAEFGQGHDNTELVADHKCGVGNIEKTDGGCEET